MRKRRDKRWKKMKWIKRKELKKCSKKSKRRWKDKSCLTSCERKNLSRKKSKEGSSKRSFSSRQIRYWLNNRNKLSIESMSLIKEMPRGKIS
jgi:hypothetical protein